MTQKRLLLLPVLFTAACSGFPKKQFEFDAIDATENPRPALIVIDDDWEGAREKNQVVNVAGDDTLPLTIEFKNSEIEVTVAPLLVEGDAVQRWPMSRKEATEHSGFKDETRRLRLNDPTRELFILPRKPAGS
ncbi:MAG: hypothetical protein K8J09_20605 [Planctomycetes bacterium]|nr:hypothetical protein [Planctomycetota bacterium]MCC7396347.1 hypothetical protein [Planctomycetota bacterium]